MWGRVRKWTEYRTCSGSANCGMEHSVQWRGVMYWGTKLWRKESQLDVIQFVSILPLKLFWKYCATCSYPSPMGYTELKINKDQIWHELLSTQAHMFDCWSTKQDLILFRPFHEQQVTSYWELCIDDMCGYWKVICGSYSVIREDIFCLTHWWR